MMITNNENNPKNAGWPLQGNLTNAHNLQQQPENEIGLNLIHSQRKVFAKDAQHIQ